MVLRRSQISRCFICEGEAGAPATVAEKSKQTHDNPCDYAPCYPFSLLHPFNCDGLHVQNRCNRISDTCVSYTNMVHLRQEYSRGEDEFLPVHWRLTRALLRICVTYADDSSVFYACFPVWIKHSSSNQRRRLVFSPTNWVNFLWLCEIICTVSVLTSHVLAGFHDGDFICFFESCVYHCSNNLGYFASHEL